MLANDSMCLLWVFSAAVVLVRLFLGCWVVDLLVLKRNLHVEVVQVDPILHDYSGLVLHVIINQRIFNLLPTIPQRQCILLKRSMVGQLSLILPWNQLKFLLNSLTLSVEVTWQVGWRPLSFHFDSTELDFVFRQVPQLVIYRLVQVEPVLRRLRLQILLVRQLLLLFSSGSLQLHVVVTKRLSPRTLINSVLVTSDLVDNALLFAMRSERQSVMTDRAVVLVKARAGLDFVGEFAYFEIGNGASVRVLAHHHLLRKFLLRLTFVIFAALWVSRWQFAVITLILLSKVRQILSLLERVSQLDVGFACLLHLSPDAVAFIPVLACSVTFLVLLRLLLSVFVLPWPILLLVGHALLLHCDGLNVVLDLRGNKIALRVIIGQVHFFCSIRCRVVLKVEGVLVGGAFLLSIFLVNHLLLLDLFGKHGSVVLVVLEYAFFYSAVGKHELTFAIFEPFEPLALIVAAIAPLHGSKSITMVEVVVALVAIARLPLKDAVPMLHVVHELAIVLVAVRPLVFLPTSVPVFESVLEVSNVRGSALPLIVSEAFRLAIGVGATVRVSIGEDVRTFAMLEAVEPFTFISVAIFPKVHSVAIHFAVAPLADVAFALDAFPSAIAMLDRLLPFSVVNFAVRPRVDALAVRLVAQVKADVLRAVAENLKAVAVASIVQPFALVDPSIRVDKNTQAVALSFDECALIQRVLRPLDLKLVGFHDLAVVKELRNHGVLVRLLLLIEVALARLRLYLLDDLPISALDFAVICIDDFRL